MEEGVLRKLYSLLNPRPLGIPAVTGQLVPVRPPYPILNREQTNLNYVLARRIPQAQSTGPVPRLSSVVYNEDVKNGSALFFAINNLTNGRVYNLIDALVLFDSDRRTPLMLAIQTNRILAMVEHMVRTNNAILTQEGHYGTPLIYAIHRKCTANTIQILIDRDQTVLTRRNRITHLLPVCVALHEGCSLEVLRPLVYPGCLDVFETPPVWVCFVLVVSFVDGL